MAANSKIEWTDATWNPIVGCSVVSAGCTNCYAMKEAWRHGHNPKTPQYQGLTKKVNGNPVWTGKVNLVKHRLTDPLHWRKPRRIFVNSMSDLFHEKVPDWWIFLILAVMAQTYDVTETNENNVVTKCAARHTYQVLTKRPGRMKSFMTDLHARAQAELDTFLTHPFSEAARRVSRALGHHYWQNAPLSSWAWVLEGCPGLWLGVSIEDQKSADERIPHLLATPATIRFISAEPLLGPVDLTSFVDRKCPQGTWVDTYSALDGVGGLALDWVIVGGESGPNARPMHPDWARSLRDQCVSAGVPFFFKQDGEWTPIPRVDTLPGRPRMVVQGDCFVTLDGRSHILGADLSSPLEGDRSVAAMRRASRRRRKTRAARMLDGREHNDFPQPVIPAKAGIQESAS